jgi:hypothetical protein
VVGDRENRWAEFSGDAQHLVRYLSSKRGRQFNWRRASLDRPLEELVKVPILFVNVVGPFAWSEPDWSKLREYCLAGGSVIFDIAESAEAQREPVLSGLSRTFPEHPLADLPADHPLFSMEEKLAAKPAVKAMGNGFREFLFLPAESWSCQFHLYTVSEQEEPFQFVNNLLTYCLDGTAPRSAFAPSPYPGATVPSQSIHALHMEVGGNRPAYPHLLDHLGRLMGSNFRTAVVREDDVNQADVVWVSVTGEKPPTAGAKEAMLKAFQTGKLIFVDVVGGSEEAGETFRGYLEALEDGIKLEKLPRTDPLYTGEIPGTVGFDVVETDFRPALHTRFAKRGRCDLYLIRYQGKPAGVFSAHDISSGIGYHFFPKCRGIMPDHAREVAMNVLLTAFERKVSSGTVQ